MRNCEVDECRNHADGVSSLCAGHQHKRDRDCSVDQFTHCCVECRVYHGLPCRTCGATAFHADGCCTLESEDTPTDGGPVDGGREWHACADPRGHKFSDGVCTVEGCGFTIMPPTRAAGGPTDPRTRLTVRVSAETFAAVDAAARADNRSRDGWIRRVINAALAREARRES